jgi:hypothetical protein
LLRGFAVDLVSATMPGEPISLVRVFETKGWRIRPWNSPAGTERQNEQ